MSRYDTVMKYFLEQKEENEKRTKENIEKYRKGDCVLNIGDDYSPDAKVIIKQINHEFKFGCNIFMLDELETA